MSPSLQPPQKDFFISYNRADRSWAEWIAWQLENSGYTVIIQAWDFRPGANFILEMDKATQWARQTIAVLSQHYLDALYTQPEWAAAFVQDPTSENGMLIPVRVEQCVLKGLLQSIGYIDLVGLNDEERARDKLLKGIQPGRLKPTSTPIFPGAKGSSPFTSSNNESTVNESTVPEILIVNAKEDETFRKELEICLRPLERTGSVTIWHRGYLKGGEDFQQTVEKRFYKAVLILFLVSQDFLASPDCVVLMQTAMQRAKTQEARIIPIIIRPCDWENSPLRTRVPLPKNGKPVIQWAKKDLAYLEIIKGIREILPK